MTDMETLVGFRSWVWDGQLRAWGPSPSMDAPIWNIGVNQAQCLINNLAYIYFHDLMLRQSGDWTDEAHDAPSEKCMCGLYAAHNLEALNRTGWACSHTQRRYVRGIVQIWGKTLVHELGVRAEFMRPIAFLSGSGHYNIRAKGTGPMTTLVTPHVGLPIIDQNDAYDFAREYGTLSETLVGQLDKR